MHFALFTPALGMSERVRAHALLRLCFGTLAPAEDEMSAPEDVMGAALVLVRAAQAPTPQVEYFSQRNCELLGLTKRAFLDLLRRPDAPRCVRVGKGRLVRRADMVEFLERLSLARAAHAPVRDGADQVLADLGCVVRRRHRGA